MSLCNESSLNFDKAKSKFTRNGLPTEAALKVLVEKIGAYDSNFKRVDAKADPEQYNNHLLKSFEVRATLEFSRDRKSMSVIAHDKSQKKNLMFIKGAPDYIINGCDEVLTPSGVKPIKNKK